MRKRIFVYVVTLVVAVQCFRPAKNLSPLPPAEDDFLVRHRAPAEIRQRFAAACYDCHSNQTRYPWYAEIQPFGWWLADHIVDGKAELNLSEFGAYSPRRQGVKIDTMIEVLEDRSMPLTSYTWLHRDAKLTETHIAELVAWLEEEREKLDEAE